MLTRLRLSRRLALRTALASQRVTNAPATAAATRLSRALQTAASTKSGSGSGRAAGSSSRALWAGAAALALAGSAWAVERQRKPAQAAARPQYSLAEVAKHKTKDTGIWYALTALWTGLTGVLLLLVVVVVVVVGACA